MIRIKKVETKKDLSDFIKFPDKLYKGNPYRVPPLHLLETAALRVDKNPAFEYCEASYWLAYKDDVIVGRIAGILSHRFVEIWGEKLARFGWIDFNDDYEVSALLFKTVEEWALSKGFTGMHGPLGFSDMDLEGALVEGFNEISTQAVIYNYPYYLNHYKKNGYTKDADWLQYEIKVPDKVPEKIYKMSELIKERYDLRVLKVKKAKELLPYGKSMFATLNESFKDLYGFVPLSEKQIDYYIKQYFSMIDPRYVCFISDKSNEIIGFGVSVPSLSKALIKARGKLFPFGFVHIIKALKKNDTIDMLLQAVKPKYQNKGIPAIFFAEMMQAYIDAGIKTAITSHALEDNKAAYLMFSDYQARQHLRRRCYIKTLGKQNES